MIIAKNEMNTMSAARQGMINFFKTEYEKEMKRLDHFEKVYCKRHKVTYSPKLAEEDFEKYAYVKHVVGYYLTTFPHDYYEVWDKHTGGCQYTNQKRTWTNQDQKVGIILRNLAKEEDDIAMIQKIMEILTCGAQKEAN